jgi:hypothetical protein
VAFLPCQIIVIQLVRNDDYLILLLDHFEIEKGVLPSSRSYMKIQPVDHQSLGRFHDLLRWIYSEIRNSGNRNAIIFVSTKSPPLWAFHKNNPND